MEIVIYTDSDDTDLQIEIESRKAILTGRRIAGLPCGYQLHKYNRAVDRKVTATLCYSCFVAASKSTINTARDVRMRRAIGRKGGKYAPNV